MGMHTHPCVSNSRLTSSKKPEKSVQRQAVYSVRPVRKRNKHLAVRRDRTEGKFQARLWHPGAQCAGCWATHHQGAPTENSRPVFRVQGSGAGSGANAGVRPAAVRRWPAGRGRGGQRLEPPSCGPSLLAAPGTARRGVCPLPPGGGVPRPAGMGPKALSRSPTCLRGPGVREGPLQSCCLTGRGTQTPSLQ